MHLEQEKRQLFFFNHVFQVDTELWQRDVIGPQKHSFHKYKKTAERKTLTSNVVQSTTFLFGSQGL